MFCHYRSCIEQLEVALSIFLKSLILRISFVVVLSRFLYNSVYISYIQVPDFYIPIPNSYNLDYDDFILVVVHEG